MQVQYGSYKHAVNEAAIAFEQEPVYSDRGQRSALRKRMHIRGELIAASQSALLTAIDSLLSTYSINGRDLLLLKDDDSTVESHSLRSAKTLGGTKVTKAPSLPEAKGAVLGTFWPYTITVEAEVPDPSVNLLAFRERVSFTGGGPRYRHRETLRGLPQKQLVNRFTVHKATQAGRAVGQLDWPAPSPPLWPASLMQPESGVDYEGPEEKGPSGTRWIGYVTTWNYLFESATPLVGRPRK